MEKFYKESWISVAALCTPEIAQEGLSKGVLVLNQVDPVLERYPSLKDLFYIVERHGWFGPNEATLADITLLEDQSVADIVRKSASSSIHLEIGPADFVDQDEFFPISGHIQYDVVQISCWSRRKRIELYIRAAAELPDVSFLHLGHFENNGSVDEIEYRGECLELARSIAPNVFFPFAHCDSNDGFPNSKSQVNLWINKARLGVLTTMSEGINRFKMECLSADRPCLVANDVAWTTRKHINSMTGRLFSPNVGSLVEAIDGSLARSDQFEPRKYVLAQTGKRNSLPKLRSALMELCTRDKSTFRYGDLEWDGRNESLLWGKDAISEINNLVDRYQHFIL